MVFLIRLLIRSMRLFLINFRWRGEGNIPGAGPAILVSNHISLLDLMLIQFLCPRRVTFMVRREVAEYVPAKFVWQALNIMPVPPSDHPKAMKRFIREVQDKLKAGKIVCFFPEGGISGNGCLVRFKSSVEKFVPAGTSVPVIPIRIGMLSERLVSFKQGKMTIHFPKEFPVNFDVNIGMAVSPSLTAFELRQKVSELGAEAEAEPQPGELPLHSGFVRTVKRNFRHSSFKDHKGAAPTNFEMLLRSSILSAKLREFKTDSQFVGVLLPNMTITSAVLLGALYADKTPAILNFSSGRETALGASRRAGVKLIVTSRKFLAKLGWEAAEEMVFLEDIAAKVAKHEKIIWAIKILLMPRKMLMRHLAPESAFDVKRLAVLLFSSGSTGIPKAVMLSHRNINCDLYAFWRVIAWTEKDKLMGNLPLFHAYGFTVGFSFMTLAGSQVVYVPNPLDGDGVIKAVAENEITILTATPTFLQNYLRKADERDLKSLRLVITGAEKLRSELAERFKTLTSMEIVEGYGCTELSPIVTINLANSIFLLGKHSDHPDSIGIPLPGIHIRIIDPETRQELPPGQSGLMQIKSGIVMQGYLNDPELTAKVLADGYYDTGDIAKMDRDGYIYITGRASRFSKIGGEMVPHELLERHLLESAKREERVLAVSSRPDGKKGEKIVVFYSDPTLVPAELIADLRRQKLPNLWIPKEEDFVLIDHLPLLGSGKLDLKKLREL